MTNDNSDNDNNNSVRNDALIDDISERNVNNTTENFIQVQEQYFSQHRPIQYTTQTLVKSTFFIIWMYITFNRNYRYECYNTYNLNHCYRNRNAIVRSAISQYYRCWYSEKHLGAMKQQNFMCQLLLLYIIILLLLSPIVVNGFSTIYVFHHKNHYHLKEPVLVQKLSVGSITYLSSLPPRQQRIEWYEHDGEIDDDDDNDDNADNYNSYYEDDDNDDNDSINQSSMIPSENIMKQESTSSPRIGSSHNDDDNSNLQTAMSNMFRVKKNPSKKNTYYSLQELEEYVQQISSTTTTKRSTSTNNNKNSNDSSNISKEDNNINGTYDDTDDDDNDNDDSSLLLSEDMYLNAERMLLEDGSIDFTSNRPMSSLSSSSSIPYATTPSNYQYQQPKWINNDYDDNDNNKQNSNDYRTIVKNRLQVSIDTNDQGQDIDNDNNINQSLLFPQLVSKNSKPSTRQVHDNDDVDEQVIDSIVTLWNQFQQLSLKTTTGPLTIDDFDDDNDSSKSSNSNDNKQDESVLVHAKIETSETKTKKTKLTKKGQLLHENIFQNENGYLQQSSIFKQSLTNTSKVYDATTSRRIKQYTIRQEHSLLQLQQQLDEMDQLLQNLTNNANTVTSRISTTGSAVVSAPSTSMSSPKIQPITSYNDNRQKLDAIYNDDGSVSMNDQHDADDFTIDSTKNQHLQIHKSTSCSTCGCRMSKEEMEWNIHRIESKQQLQQQQLKNSNDYDDNNDDDDELDSNFDFIHQYICHICHSKNLLSTNYQQQQDTYSRYGLLTSTATTGIAKKNIRKYRTTTTNTASSSLPSSAITGANSGMLSPRQLGIKINFGNSID